MESIEDGMKKTCHIVTCFMHSRNLKSAFLNVLVKKSSTTIYDFNYVTYTPTQSFKACVITRWSHVFDKSPYLLFWIGYDHQTWLALTLFRREFMGYLPYFQVTLLLYGLMTLTNLNTCSQDRQRHRIWTTDTGFGQESIECSSSGVGNVITSCPSGNKVSISPAMETAVINFGHQVYLLRKIPQSFFPHMLVTDYYVVSQL